MSSMLGLCLVTLICFVFSASPQPPASSIPPPEWTCLSDQWWDNKTCDCNCGPIVDPDCYNITLGFYGCPSSANWCNLTDGKCEYLDTPPTAWVAAGCDAAHWKDGSECDCECGAYDPDCENPNNQIHRCASHVTTCKWTDGSCQYEYPPEWTCFRHEYNDTKLCNCNCGAYDPDCDNSSLPIMGCGYSATSCSQTGHCIFSINPPPQWTCPSSWYGADAWCDCGCGAYDPDCEDDMKILYGCGDQPGSDWCSYKAECIVDPHHRWTCDTKLYDDGQTCNCGCGKHDPDCDDPNNPLVGCPPTAIGCTSEGECQYPAPDGWKCAMYSYNSGDGCDCNCGAFDPDCTTDTNVDEIRGCGKGVVGCDQNGKCVYESKLTTSEWDAFLLAVVIALTPPIVIVFLVCCCLVCVLVVPAVINIAIIIIFREAKRRRAAGEAETPFERLEDEEDEVDAIGMESELQDHVGMGNSGGFDGLGPIADFQPMGSNVVGRTNLDFEEEEGSNISIKRKKEVPIEEEERMEEESSGSDGEVEEEEEDSNKGGPGRPGDRDDLGGRDVEEEFTTEGLEPMDDHEETPDGGNIDTSDVMIKKTELFRKKTKKKKKEREDLTHVPDITSFDDSDEDSD